MELFFLITLFIVAFLYASIGHGGASGYLALMAMFGIEAITMRSSALILNLFVAGIAFYSYYKGGYFKWKILLPFVIASMPAAFLGAKLSVDPTFYKISLGICLLIAVARMLLQVKSKKNNAVKNPNILIALVLGCIVGFFSGMIGIGGGIILSPILIVFGWANLKEAAAISAGFIWLNSATGLLGTISSGVHFAPMIVLWIAVALLGGFLGSWSGSFKFSSVTLRYVLASVLFMASIKLFFI
ncbi:sulfite exporter TauE/SafE family protein [Thalassobellus citreus]|uniref:sulfite exporter TauE/SafE family protein n=1 Tax=Thalassobellus citreus TaxID=3367752 RepID=UPI0037AA3E5E